MQGLENCEHVCVLVRTMYAKALEHTSKKCAHKYVSRLL